MIKESIKRKFIITTFALLVFLMTLSFPKNEPENSFVSVHYESDNTSPIYLLNHAEYVSRTSMHIEGESIEEEAKNILSILTIGEKYANYIPTLFEPIIPKGTKIISMDLQDTTLKINFSKELLNIPKNMEEKLIECIVYSLTEIKGVKGIIIYVDGKLLETIPNTTYKLPPLLTRNIGVNKIYDIESVKNVTKTTMYYIAKEQDTSYFVPVTILENNDKNKVEIIIEHLKSLPNEKTNLMSYLNASTELSNYEILESQVLLSFSNLLYEGLASKDLLEEVKYSISLSIEDSLNVENVIFLNN